MCTFGLGCLLGLVGALLVLATLAVVGGRPLARLDPSIPRQIADRAREVLPAIDGGPVWQVVSRVRAPWGEIARLRPFLAEIEVRGADCVLVVVPEGSTSPAASTGARFERDLSAVDWSALRDGLAPILQPEAKRRSLAFLAVDSTLSLPVEPRCFVELSRTADRATGWSLRMEVTVSGRPAALAAALRAIPVTGDAAETEGPFDLVLTLDPATLAVTAAEDARFFATGTGYVFDPNPVVTSGRVDLRNGDEVDAWRRSVTLERLDGSGDLNGALVATVTNRPPRAHDAALLYDYGSADPRFEEVMAYYHGDRAISHAESLGFSHLLSQPLSLRLHSSSADNSWYSHPTREIIFGDGGVDDAEDADIILHECGHALHDAIVPGFGAGDTRALSEGFSDFWAASLTGGTCVGDWDATSYSPPCLRRVDEPAIYPGWLNGLSHHDGMLWSALLWDLRMLLGARDAERLAVATLFETDTGTTWPEAAGAIPRAAARLGLVAELPRIREAVARRGFGPMVIEASLDPDEARRIDLMTPARFLNHEATAVLLQGDGRLLFLRTGDAFEARPFPAGPPTVVPCGRERSGDDQHLELRFEIEGGSARIRQRWLDGTTEIARIAVAWDLLSGELAWRYEYFDPQRARGFFAGATDGVPENSTEEVTPVRLTDLTATGIGGLRAFRAELERPVSTEEKAPLLGAGFALSADTTGFRLRGRSAPIAAWEGELDLSVLPNPVRGRAEIRLLLPHTVRAEIALYDVLGRRVRSWGTGERPVGLTAIEWNGRDASGRSLPAGLYWVRVEADGRSAARRVLVLN